MMLHLAWKDSRLPSIHRRGVSEGGRGACNRWRRSENGCGLAKFTTGQSK